MSSLIVEVCKVNSVEPHPNADKLDLIGVKGWSCIVGRNNYKVGGLVVFCPTDSIIPPNLIEKYSLEFLRKNGRVGTIKLRGVISQGLVLDIPLGVSWEEGQDVANELGITKWEPPVQGPVNFRGQTPTKKKLNPLFDVYTDIENIKNFPDIFIEGEPIVLTEKIHGTNFRAGVLSRYTGSLWGCFLRLIFGKYEFVYGSHRVQKTVGNRNKGFYGEDVYGQIAKKYNLAKVIPSDFLLYGEIYGPGIQDLAYGQKEIDVVFFDVKYKGQYLDYQDFKNFCMGLKLPVAPELYVGQFDRKILESETVGNSTLSGNQVREGVVVRPFEEQYDNRIGRKILKSVNLEYLLRKNPTEFH